MRLRDLILPTAAFGAATGSAAALGVVATRSSVDTPWYDDLAKPPFQPPKQAFAPVWTALYAGIAASGIRIWLAPSSKARTRALALWAIQLGLNAGWSAIFFKAKRPKWALVEIGALLGAIALYANEARKVDKPAAWLVAPYLAWTGFAAVLNEEIARRNA